jgi:hypothetical protein
MLDLGVGSLIAAMKVTLAGIWNVLLFSDSPSTLWILARLFPINVRESREGIHRRAEFLG